MLGLAVSTGLVSLDLRGTCGDVLISKPPNFLKTGGEVLLIVLIILRGVGGEPLPAVSTLEGRGGLESLEAPLLLRGDGGVILSPLELKTQADDCYYY